MAKLADVTTPYWQLSTTTQGEIVQGFDSLRQNLFNLLQTERGSVPYEPGFGLNLASIIDRPTNAVIAILKNEIIQQALEFIPRIKITKLESSLDNQSGSVTITVFWKSANSAIKTISITY